MQVEHSAFFNKAVFDGPADFVGVQVARDFEANEARFTNAERPASFNSMQVKHAASFHKAVFAGPVNFVGVQVASDFEANEARFTNNAEQSAIFEGMHVGASARFNEAVFAGRVNFGNMQVASNFEADGARFTNRNQKAIFEGMHVGNIVSFQNIVFEGPVFVTDANFRDLLIEGSKDTASSWPFLDLSRTVINSELRITHVTLQDLLALALRVEGRAILSELKIEGRADLQYSNFAILHLPKVSEFMIDAEAVLLLDGMTYQQLNIGTGGGKAPRIEETLEDLLALAKKAVYSRVVPQ
jgi:hypothetical protein